MSSTRQCLSCGTIIPPTNKRGRPRLRCTTCVAAKPEFYKEPCNRCHQPIPHTHKRGRPPAFHKECMQAIIAKSKSPF